MRLVHMADAHLGFSAYSRFDTTTNLNVREKDFYQAFTLACEKARELRPDVVVIAGDLFHLRKPSATAITCAQSTLGLFRCPVIVIAGNHDNSMYRMRSPLISLQILDNVYCFESPGFVEIQGATFECIPFTETPPTFRGADYLVAHLRDRRAPKFHDSVIEVPAEKYKLGLLGDLHMPYDVTDNLFYCGAIERVSFNQVNSPCGFNFYSDGTAKSKEYIEIKTRPFVDLTQPPQDLESIRDAVVRCTITSAASTDWVNQLKEAAFFVIVRVLERLEEESSTPLDLTFGSILDTFDEYCKANESKYAPDVVALARQSLVQAIEENEV